MTGSSPRQPGSPPAGKSTAAFRTIGEVSGELGIPHHVLRFWESRFTQLKPLKGDGGRRYYRPDDIELLRQIRELLYTDGYTIKGAQKLLRNAGAKSTPPRQATGDARPAQTGAAARDGAGQALPKGVARDLRSIRSELVKIRDLMKRAADHIPDNDGQG